MASTTNTDRIDAQFGVNLSSDHFYFAIDGDDLVISAVDAKDNYIRIVDHMIDTTPYSSVWVDEGHMYISSVNHWLLGNENSETLNGTSSADTIVSNGGGDIINAGDGNDTIYGSSFSDYINVGAGMDEVWSGHGDDVIFFENAAAINGDTIRDYAGNDTISLGNGISMNDISFSASTHHMTVTISNSYINLPYQVTTNQNYN